MVAFLRATLGFEQDVMKEGGHEHRKICSGHIADSDLSRQHLKSSQTPKLAHRRTTGERRGMLMVTDLLSTLLVRSMLFAMQKLN